MRVCFSLEVDSQPAGVTCNCPKGRLPAERTYSTVFDSDHGRFEKLFAKVTCHKFFKGKNHLHFKTIVCCVHVTLHTTALWSRQNQQYPSYGNWSHF